LGNVPSSQNTIKYKKLLTKYCNYIITFKEKNMIVSVIPIGNSKGIRIPKNILTELSIGNEAEMNITNDEIIISRIEKNAPSRRRSVINSY
jgi:antitoxin MazE